MVHFETIAAGSGAPLFLCRNAKTQNMEQNVSKMPQCGRKFAFGDKQIRVTKVCNQPFFVAKDICQALGLSNCRMVLKSLDDDEKGVSTIYTLGGRQKISVINESGLYHLIFLSRKPEAKAFRKWVTSQVLPQIRKHGFFAVHKRIYPAELSAEHNRLFQNMIQFIAPDDYRIIALSAGVKVKHVKQVAKGKAQSAKVLSLLLNKAKQNKANGLHYTASKAIQKPDYLNMLNLFSSIEENTSHE